MAKINLLILALLFSSAVAANSSLSSNESNHGKIERAVLDYIESQHKVQPAMMARGLDKKLAKRTYWQGKDGVEFVMETDFDTMLYVAENYNKAGDKFAKNARVIVQILDVDNRVASVKLTVDDWIDYMHLYQNAEGEWKIINVLWQYHDERKHVSSSSK